MKYSKCGLAVSTLLLLGSCGGHVRHLPPGGGFGSNPLWDDGKSEVSTYSGSDERDLQSHPVRARLVLSLSPPPSPGAPRGVAGERVFSMQLSVVSPASVPGDSAVTVASLRRADLAPLELSGVDIRGRDTMFVKAAAPEASTTQLTRLTRGGGATERVTSVDWPADDRPQVCWDALPLWLRQWVGEKTPLELRVWLLPGLVFGPVAGGSVTPVDATIRMMDRGTIQVPAGRFAALEFAVSTGGESDAFWLNASYPHELLKLKTARHLALELQSTRRVAAPAAP